MPKYFWVIDFSLVYETLQLEHTNSNREDSNSLASVEFKLGSDREGSAG